MNAYNDYGFMEQSRYWSMGHQIRHDLNHLRVDLRNSIDFQTQTQTTDARMFRDLFARFMDSVKSIFTGKKENDGGEETFYEMVQRENSETQAWLEEQANQQKYSVANLGSIINSLNAISKDIQDDTKSNKNLQDAISKLQIINNNYNTINP